MKIDVYRKERIDEDLVALMKEYNTPEDRREILLFQQIRLLRKIEAAILLNGAPATATAKEV